MARLREYLNTAPLVPLTLIAGLPFGLAMFVMWYLFFPLPLFWVNLPVSMVAGLAFGFSMARFVRKQLGQMGGVDTARSVDRAITSRMAPVDPPSDEWTQALAHRERQARHYRWAGPAMFVPFAVLSAANAMWGLLPAWFSWAGMVFFLVLAVIYPFWTRRQLGAIEEVRKQLGHPERAGSQPK